MKNNEFVGDPSLRNYGWAIVSKNKIVDCGCIQTKSTGKRIVEETHSIVELTEALTAIFTKYKPVKVYFEAFVGSQSSAALAGMAYSKAITISLATVFGIEWKAIGAVAIKNAVGGQKNTEKEEIFQKVAQKFPELTTKTSGWNKTRKYAVSDALAVYLSRGEI